MKEISEEIIQFLQKQSFAIVSTIDKEGFPHCSCKGILEIDKTGKIYLVDLYKGKTYENLIRDPHISITAVDDRHFRGYCLKAIATIIEENKLKPRTLKLWDEKIAGRISSRVLRNIQEEKIRQGHPEAYLPRPEYVIVLSVEDVINLTPRHIK